MENPYRAPESTRLAAGGTGPWLNRTSQVGIGIAAAVLIHGGLYPFGEIPFFLPLGIFTQSSLCLLVFVIALFVQILGLVQHAYRSQIPQATTAAAVFVGLVILASFPWYVPHWSIRDGTNHRHSIWELGHVH